MWLGEFIGGVEKAVSDINEHNFGRAQKRLRDLIEEAKQNGIVTMIKVD